MLSLFLEKWENEVKALAEKCITEPEFVRLMIDYEEKKLTQREQEYLQKVRIQYKDPIGMFQIANMVWKVDSALADGRADLMSVFQVYKFLSAPNYLKEVFQGDSSSEEWKNRMALRDGLKKLF